MTRRVAGFVVDLHRCTGCSTCVLACRLEHQWPSSAPWRRVIPVNEARYPTGPTYFLPVACHHCEQPACVRACPSAALSVRPDGVVVHSATRCLGCRYCEMACPFDAPRYDEGRGVMSKCEFCRERVDRGEAPACVTACPTGALRKFEDAGDQSKETVPGFADPAGCRPSIKWRRG